ncbi:MAG: PIN domain-containing protein [Bacteroidota bacterium]|nr:PIN domain-containing protein [Bacteroidota bacterium]
MATKYSTRDVTVINGRKVFFDANVLIYIFWPTGNYNWEKYYSSTFGRLLRQENELFVDYMVISEIINRTHRSEFEKHLIANEIPQGVLKYKQYRDSEDGKNALKDINLIINDVILDKFSIIGKSFTKTDIQSFLTTDTLDFADKVINLLCKENSFILLTNDADFKNADIDILTSNPALLSV